MLAALALTYIVPFELLLLAYVVLGPAHYATEISWLHDRKYFLPQSGIAVALATLAIIAAMIDNAAWSAWSLRRSSGKCSAGEADAAGASVFFVGLLQRAPLPSP
jgi:hypothetical protein